MSTKRVTVTECPGGPLLIRGADEVTGIDGSTAQVERSVVALCRCGRSERMPWCDASHRAKRRRPKRSTDDQATDQAKDKTKDDQTKET